MEKQQPQKQAGFPTIPTTEKDWVIDNCKNAKLQSRAYFSIYQQPDDDKIFIYEIK
ncbi:MAG TPA: hypothetical protein VJ111_00090 [Chitinophagaceae bacterium]|nr:hypothetical protein [Chitinophagaceae bacterium]